MSFDRLVHLSPWLYTVIYFCFGELAIYNPCVYWISKNQKKKKIIRFYSDHPSIESSNFGLILCKMIKKLGISYDFMDFFRELFTFRWRVKSNYLCGYVLWKCVVAWRIKAFFSITIETVVYEVWSDRENNEFPLICIAVLKFQRKSLHDSKWVGRTEPLGKPTTSLKLL